MYTIFCAAQFVSISGNVYTTIILDDGVSIGGTDLQSSTGYSINPEATVVTELAAGAHVTCNAYQVSGTSQSTTTAAQRTAFGAARLY